MNIDNNQLRSALLICTSVFGLAACTNPLTNQPVTAADVQAAAVTICGFQPTIDVAANVLTSNGTNAQTAEAIGAMICKAVAGGKHVAGRRLGGVATVTGGTVNGVRITGTWVR